MPARQRLALAVLLTVVTAAACGDGEVATTASAMPTTATSSPETTTTVAPDPETVIVAGDSIIYDVSPAVAAAVDPRSATVIPVVAPSLAADSSRLPLIRRIETTSADVVAVMVGVWERAHVARNGLVVGEPGFAAEYADEALDPIRLALAPHGGRLLILGPPHLREAEAEHMVVELEEVWSAYAAEHDEVEFLDADAWIGDQPVFTELESDGSTTIRLRRTDGIHLCEEGARRIAAGLLSQIAAPGTPPLQLVDGWEAGDWTSRFPVDECPLIP